VIGINNRDLGTFEVNMETTRELCSDVPTGKTLVAESGYRTPEQLEELDELGIDAVLIGETLMRSENVEAAVRALTRDEELTREHLLSDDR
jgi:indole-3-glycerol phosphate synthase